VGQILLTKGQVAIVDDVNHGLLNAYKWHAILNRDTKSFYAARNSPSVDGKRHHIYMAREVMHAKTGEVVDHINHDTLDNRQENLRVCSSGQNNANTRMRSHNTSGFKGVCWHSGHGKWTARLRFDRKLLHLGDFTTALEAAIVYDRAALGVFGEFALTNQMLGLIPANK